MVGASRARAPPGRRSRLNFRRVGDDRRWHVELLWPVQEAFVGATLVEALG